MDFISSIYFPNEPLISWTFLDHFCHHFWVGLLLQPQLRLPSGSLKIVNLMFVKCQIRTFLCALWSICLSKKWLITFISYGSILKAAYSQNILCFLLHIQTCGQNHCPLSFKHRSVDRWVLGHIYNMKNQFWDGLGSRSSTEKTNLGSIMSNFWGLLFHVFLGKKLI